MSVISQDGQLVVSWFAPVIENDAGEQVIGWTPQLEDRYSGPIQKYPCEFEDEPDLPCFEVRLDDFRQMLGD